ncbi:MAG: beta-lactamase family protein [Clostridia bacterium]|nr:beta-lactamase family protein [Clostridia bacterium]
MGNIWPIYRKVLAFLPKHGRMNGGNIAKAGQAEKILRKYRCLGASFCTFDEKGITGWGAFGEARKGVPAGEHTVYRIASVSKLISAMGAMRLQEKGVLSMDREVNDYLPISLRHPKAPDTPITLRMLMSHTAGIHDGEQYNTGIAKNVPLSQLLQGDSFCAHLPGEAWEYSNFGAGIAGAVMEAAAGVDFEALMQREVFRPLSVQATFYPQKVQGELADATRILPPQKAPNFNARARMARPLPEERVDAHQHYNLAHGNLCISTGELAKLGMALMMPGFLTEKSLQEMRRIICPFGERAHNLSQGVGTFILQDDSICSRPLYGHQGMAYGACHGLFFDIEKKRGVVLLTSGVSEARRGVLSDVNADMIRLYLAEEE